MSGTSARYAHSEATRLLSAGVHLDVPFRQRVLDELTGHPESPVAPSLGVDVLRVLAHALRARRQELYAALGLFVLWILFFATAPGTGPSSFLALFAGKGDAEKAVEVLAFLAAGGPLAYAFACFLLLAGRYLSGSGTLVTYTVGTRRLSGARRRASRWRRGSGRLVTFWGRAVMAVYWVGALAGITEEILPVVFPLAMALIVWVHRARVESVLRDELGRHIFRERPFPEVRQGAPLPKVFSRTPALGRTVRAIAREQHAQGVLYDSEHPFVGAGTPYLPWSFAMELMPRPTRTGRDSVPAQGGPVQLTSSRVVELIRRPLEELRRVTAESSIDRLRDLEIDEFVHLPAGISREDFYSAGVIREHLRAAVDEGGEGRRHFLRIRVGAWDEEVVVTVFVRVHTQGGMLVLEVLPHVLGPVRDDFRDGAALVAGGGAEVAGNALRALLHAPSAMGALFLGALLVPFTGVRSLWRKLDRRLPDAPVRSVREMGSAGVSFFQEMDVSRYLKTVQDRIESGVREALEESAYATDRFDQQVVNVLEGGLFIGQMKSGYATGRISGGVVAMGKQSTASGRPADAGSGTPGGSGTGNE